MRLQSIRFSLTATIAVLLALLIIVSISAVTSLVGIKRQIETIDGKWMAATQMLGDLKNTVSEFRVAEGYRYLAVDQPGAIQAEFLAESDAATIDKMLGRFEGLSRDSGIADDLQRFGVAWQALLKQHRTWIDEAAGEQIAPTVGYGSALQKRYEAVQLAAENLIDDARQAAKGEADEADRSAHEAAALVEVLAALAAVLALGLMARIELQITRPLVAITTALSRLAAGDRTVQVPEAHRKDEIGAMATAFDVFRANAVALTEAQKRAEALARHDALTGLANRRLFATELDAALGRTADGSACAVMLIDLDRFKPVNDLHGHPAGDQVLCVVAARLRDLVGPGGVVARLGGDEFAVITRPEADRASAINAAIGLAGRIVSSLTESIELERARVSIGASIGISVCSSVRVSAEEVLRTADLAMYRAKHDGRGTFRFFESEMDAELRARADLESDLRLALERGDIKPFYQPIVDLTSGRIAGFEVLARWNHRERGFVPPDAFIPVIEQFGGLRRMTEVILRQALNDAKFWGPDISLAVNISPTQFQDVGFAAMVADMLLAAGCAASRLEIEVTETALVGNLAAAKFTLSALQELGVRVVLDDFGTGYSSLSHLRELRFNKIKIDRSFIGSMSDNADSATIVEAVLDLAGRLGMPAVAEGIETSPVKDRLIEQGCAFGQGYLFSRAVPADAAIALLSGSAADGPLSTCLATA